MPDSATPDGAVVAIDEISLVLAPGQNGARPIEFRWARVCAGCVGRAPAQC